VQCHSSGADASPTGPESSAPDLGRVVNRQGFTDSFFLMNLIAGRGDALPNTWRHEGITAGEYPLEDLLSILDFVKDNESVD
jgi:hypothetical protein